LNGEVLIRESMRELVNQRGISHIYRSPIGDEQLFSFEVVKCRCLFGQEIDRRLLEIEARGGETELLQGRLFRTHLFGLDRLFDLLSDVLIDLLPRYEGEGQLFANTKTGDVGELLEDGVDFLSRGKLRRSDRRSQTVRCGA
jgi:hypothetical protein